MQEPPATEQTEGITQHGAEHLLLLVPSVEGELQSNAMETFFQACATDEPFALELVGTRREQGFVLRASSAEQLLLLSKQFAATYPQAELRRIAQQADPLRLHPEEQALIGTLALAQKSYLPLKTFSGKTLVEPGSDPLPGILAAMEPIGSGQRLIVQLVLKRAPDSWIARDLRKSVEHPLQGERDEKARDTHPSASHNDTAQGVKTLLQAGGLLALLAGARWYLTHAWVLLILLVLFVIVAGIALLWWRYTHSRQEIYDMKLVAEKLSRQAFYTHLRLIAIGPATPSTQGQLLAHLKRVEVAYRQFTLASANSLTLTHLLALSPVHPQAPTLPQVTFPAPSPWRRLLPFLTPGPDIWNSLELAGAFHLPQASTDLPLVERLSVKHLLASPLIAHQMQTVPGPLPPALIGTSRQRGYAVPVYLPFAALFSHKFLIARSRYGKSTLIQLLAQAAMQPVRDQVTPQPGLFVIDPHKDLIEDLLLLIPPARAGDVVLLDLTETEHVVALNPLDASMGFTRDQAVANLMASFERVWAAFWGPRMSYFLKAVCLLLYTLNQQKVQQGHPEQQYTLLDVNPLLQYPGYATRALQELDMSETWHQELFAWWVQVYFQMPRQSSFRNEVIMPIVSKLGLFQDNQHIRRIVGQPITAAPLHLAITEGKIVLCALSSRDMDDAAINILGSTLVNLLHRAFNRQQALPLKQRRRVFCAADEFHALAGGDWDRLLSEDAKLGCSLLLATQNLTRLNKIREGLLEMVFSNCENLFAFNVSAADAKLLEEELRGVVEAKHIISQPRLHCYARLSLPDAPVQIASVSLRAPASWTASRAREQLARSIRERHLQQQASVDDIDRQYAAHLAQFLDVAPFVQKMQRDATDLRAEQQARQQREHATQLAREVQQQQTPQRHPLQGTGPAATSPPRDRMPDLYPSGDGKPASIGTSLAGGTGRQRARSEEENDEHAMPAAGGHNHVRSKRHKKKDPVGVPPPFPNDGPEASPQDEQDQPRWRRGNLGTGGGGWDRERGEGRE